MTDPASGGGVAEDREGCHPAGLPAQVVARLTAAGRSVACAESLTGGLVCAALTSVPGASAVFRAGVVAYSASVKVTLLGVPAGLLAERGAVDPEVAAHLALGVRGLVAADYGLATTGVAGPDPADGKPVGTVYVAVAGPTVRRVRALSLSGDREQIRAESVRAVLALLWESLTVEEAAAALF